VTGLRRALRRLVHREPLPEVFDVWTRTEREQRVAEIDARRRRYLRTILPAVGLVLFGFFVPAPTVVRLGALVLAALLVPFAVAATVPRR
jgi:hypothetical protein